MKRSYLSVCHQPLLCPYAPNNDGICSIKHRGWHFSTSDIDFLPTGFSPWEQPYTYSFVPVRTRYHQSGRLYGIMDPRVFFQVRFFMPVRTPWNFSVRQVWGWVTARPPGSCVSLILACSSWETLRLSAIPGSSRFFRHLLENAGKCWQMSATFWQMLANVCNMLANVAFDGSLCLGVTNFLQFVFVWRYACPCKAVHLDSDRA